MATAQTEIAANSDITLQRRVRSTPEVPGLVLRLSPSSHVVRGLLCVIGGLAPGLVLAIFAFVGFESAGAPARWPTPWSPWPRRPAWPNAADPAAAVEERAQLA